MVDNTKDKPTFKALGGPDIQEPVKPATPKEVPTNQIPEDDIF